MNVYGVFSSQVSSAVEKLPVIDFPVGKNKISEVTLQSSGLKLVLRNWLDDSNWLFVSLDIINISVVNKFWKNTLSRSLAEVKEI